VSTVHLARRKITPPQVAKLWGIDVNKVLHWIRSGQLKAINGARKASGTKPRYLIDIADLEAFERSRSAVTDATERPARMRRQGQAEVTEYF
jgi:hypothetical protein